MPPAQPPLPGRRGSGAAPCIAYASQLGDVPFLLLRGLDGRSPSSHCPRDAAWSRREENRAEPNRLGAAVS